jgi:hypothetical protein
MAYVELARLYSEVRSYWFMGRPAPSKLLWRVAERKPDTALRTDARVHVGNELVLAVEAAASYK